LRQITKSLWAMQRRKIDIEELWQ